MSIREKFTAQQIVENLIASYPNSFRGLTVHVLRKYATLQELYTIDANVYPNRRKIKKHLQLVQEVKQASARLNTDTPLILDNEYLISQGHDAYTDTNRGDEVIYPLGYYPISLRYTPVMLCLHRRMINTLPEKMIAILDATSSVPKKRLLIQKYIRIVAVRNKEQNPPVDEEEPLVPMDSRVIEEVPPAESVSLVELIRLIAIVLAS